MYAFSAVKDGNTTTTMKMKGITLNHTTMKRLNMDLLKKKVKKFIRTGVQEETDIVEERIQRQTDRTVVTAPLRKKYRVVYDKRRILRDGSTLPFGY